MNFYQIQLTDEQLKNRKLFKKSLRRLKRVKQLIINDQCRKLLPPDRKKKERRKKKSKLKNGFYKLEFTCQDQSQIYRKQFFYIQFFVTILRVKLSPIRGQFSVRQKMFKM